MGVVPAVRGVDACVWSVREGWEVHVSVESVHVVFPSLAGCAGSGNGQAGEKLFILGFGKVLNDIGLAA